MFWLFQHEATSQTVEHAGEAAAKHGAEASEHVPMIVEMVNHWIGKPVHDFEVAYTKPLWDKVLGAISPGTTAEGLFGPYTVENAVPWWTVMFVIACLLSIVVIWFLRRKLSEDDPSHGQLTLEAGVLAIRQLLYDNVGPHGLRYFPVVATFGVIILISNLMALIPGLMPPTSATSVTFALGISSFVYYNYVGIRENGLFGHLRHFGGPIIWLFPLMFLVELISNFVRPISLGVRLFGNMFSDEQVASNFMNMAPPYTYFLIPAILMPLSVFVAFMQTFIFVLLSMIYIGEVSHGAHEHDDHGDHGDHAHPGGLVTAPEIT